ncbi:TetR/AcrR family transcriptional regulator [Ktedonospora formicarum]|uniref:HTH tetR-type domain-containing protein n=1 Tax=Ktedonospora formicarum TaxID=2778364 RepID=A0A8J3I2A2_9CHLR|nr:TetR/AcrR family transcriptional regulator [Ktedonospora formicarum]GHO46291.1 hypothetical protein KSX_44540 [Ktedonospora formicarum]
MKKQGTTNLRVEAAEASKKAILDAAEALFAEKGYDATSLQEICDSAGVTRGLPGYFFGSKDGLYRAVLERSMARAQDLVTYLREQIQSKEVRGKELLKIIIELLYDEFTSHPTFIHITEWEALHKGRYLGNLPAQLQVLRDGLQVLQEDTSLRIDAEQFLIDFFSLCWFPVVHTYTFLKPLGINIQDPEFKIRHKHHVVQLLLRSSQI